MLILKFFPGPASGARSKSWEAFKDEHLDFVVSVSEQAERRSCVSGSTDTRPIGHNYRLRLPKAS
jgi:hypothetical protein